MGSGIVLDAVSKRYGKVVAVDRVSLEVEAGEFMVILGPSGSGKSTLLRLVAGIEELDEGRILLGGQRIDQLLPRYRDVAMVFQSYALYPHMTVFGNLAFPLRCAHVPREEIRSRVTAVAEQLGLVDLLGRRPAQLSGGQQQRVALGRAIIRRPAAFLMDEPLSNLDAQLRARTRLDLVDLHRRWGVTTLYVTHDQVEAMTMGERIAVIDRGVIRQVGPPAEIYDYPADTVVAEFIGSPPMNLLPATVEVDGDAVRVTVGRAIVDLPRSWFAQDGRHGPDQVSVGIRAEALSVVAADDPRAIPGEVSRLELLGHEQLVHVATPVGTVIVRQPSRARLREGERIGVLPAAERLRVFDASGRLVGPLPERCAGEPEVPRSAPGSRAAPPPGRA